MEKILTRPPEIVKNPRVLYTGNHYIGLPEIHNANASIKSLNIISLSNKGLVEIVGEEALFKPIFYKGQRELKIRKVIVKTEAYYVPFYQMVLEEGITLSLRIYADIKEKGFIYHISSSEEIEIRLECNVDKLNLLRFNSHQQTFSKHLNIDKWLGNPVLSIVSASTSFALAFGGEENFSFDRDDGKGLELRLRCNKDNCFYISLNSDQDGASTTLIHLKRKGYQTIYNELKQWLNEKYISYPEDLTIERRINQNLFFNYFFAIGKDLDTDNYVALTSRSPRYYVSGAFWERDSFLWSFPAIRIIDRKLYLELAREMILRHSKNAGDHAHYLDGTVLYPGFELDEAAAYFILLEDFEEIDQELLRALDRVYSRIEKEYDETTGLFKTVLLPSDDPSEYPLVTIDNVILWRGLKNLKALYARLGWDKKADFLSERIDGLAKGIHKCLVKEIKGKPMFVWSADSEGNYRLYNDPPGNLGLLYYYGFIDYRDEVYKNTISYYYSNQYKYYFQEAKIKELACDHHPNTPSGLGLCGSILNPLMQKEALTWLREAKMDYGLLAESFDKDTGEAKTGVGFATGSGFLAFALYHVLIGVRP